MSFHATDLDVCAESTNQLITGKGTYHSRELSLRLTLYAKFYQCCHVLCFIHYTISLENRVAKKWGK